ncbi:MAG: lysine--tRNA ligase [Candidatus Gracilibacteria bacterium]|jgi:lysyl-tRNA synthetase class 1|nr:lysine--tRNA ligase [Candidatus Gracilibacteria bacterium]
MYWINEKIEGIRERFKDRISKKDPLIVREEKTLSGRVHIGSLRAAALHGIVAEKLQESGIEAKFSFEVNDFDPMDGCSPDLIEEFGVHMGKPLCNVPSPDGKAENFAEYFADIYTKVILDLGFEPVFHRASDLYKTGKMNDVIKKSLENAPRIRELYKKISKTEKPDDWYPFQVICPKCGKVGTSRVYDFDGEEVSFVCEENMVSWAKGCGHKGKISPFNGNGKLPWKVEWGAKWAVLKVDVEGAGKDHYTKGGSRDITKAICNEIFDYPTPFDMPHEFILVGGKKMSSSKGTGASADVINELLPPEINRLLLLRKDPKKIINFDPEGETIPTLYDEFDELERIYIENDSNKQDFIEAFKLLKTEEELKNIKTIFRPRFRELAFIVQLPHLDLKEKLAEIKGSELTELEFTEATRRIEYLQKWLKDFAPEKYIFDISDELKLDASLLSQTDKEVLSEILKYFEKMPEVTGHDLHGFFHSLKEKLEISPKEVFTPIYLAFLNKKEGPKAGFLLSVLDRDFVIKRLQEIL